MMPRSGSESVPLESVEVRVFRVPTDTTSESDGTFTWSSTTMVLVQTVAGGDRGIGYTYTDASATALVRDTLAEVIRGMNVLDVARIWSALVTAVRNIGRGGIASMAIAAIDAALWDLKAKLFGLPLVALLGAARDAIPVYGSGGFTSYSEAELCKQLSCWVAQGIPRVKMKIGREPSADAARVAAARRAIGDSAELFVDANGAYGVKQAIAQAQRFAESGVSWFEEPVNYRDLDGLRFVRRHTPPGMEISIGEYGFVPDTFASILKHGAVDVLQADASRCEGITGFGTVDGLCDATMTPLSTHCAPSLHVHAACAAKRVRHLEYFHDHVRIEHLFFDGALSPVDGFLRPDLGRPGLGLTLKEADARKFERT
jgi:L-alanine-DL-glutamate epimerase-like enolase superfamily enzyme